MKKNHLVDKLHWDVINDLLSYSDVIYLGDIKSHNIVKRGKNTSLNGSINDLKFYQLKQRLLYKAGLEGKRVYLVKENYTSKTCSSCGVQSDVGKSKVFKCSSCCMITGRDMNASKNMILKGIFRS